MKKKLLLMFLTIFFISTLFVYLIKNKEFVNSYNYYFENEYWEAECIIKEKGKNKHFVNKSQEILYNRTLKLTYRKDLSDFDNVEVLEYSFKDGTNETKEKIILNKVGLKNRILTLSSTTNIPSDYNQDHTIEVLIIRDNKKEILHLKTK
ncbi:hypothetical protein [Wukongibacter sp. M2B1]|uniref:hypothetical protein n=1 Tax=Wukongibacter sp. M2B1 TaxID=3088895 RepID=UPI003D7A42EF